MMLMMMEERSEKQMSQKRYDTCVAAVEYASVGERMAANVVTLSIMWFAKGQNGIRMKYVTELGFGNIMLQNE